MTGQTVIHNRLLALAAEPNYVGWCHVGLSDIGLYDYSTQVYAITNKTSHQGH